MNNLVGDDKQLASIERGGMFGALRQEHGAAELHQVRRVADAEQKRAFNRMHAGDFQAALEVFDRIGSIHWSLSQDATRDALVSKYAGDSMGEPGGKRFFTRKLAGQINEQTDLLKCFGC